MTVDKQLLDMMLSVHSEFPVLDEPNVLSIIDLLASEDAEVQVTGISVLNTFNYFKTPSVINSLYEHFRINNEVDTYDQFALMVRLCYANSKVNKLLEEDNIYDELLNTVICKNLSQRNEL